MGKKKQPVYKVVAADSRSPRDGKFLEAIGLYNPLTNPHTVEIKEDRAMYWLNVGAQPTYTVKRLLKGVPEERIAVELENWGRLREAKVMSGASKKKSAVKKESQKTGKEEIENGTAEVKGAASEDTSSGEK
jgi:small subunit ribosomal protein S16